MSLRPHPEANDEAWEIGTRYAVRDFGRAMRFDRALDEAFARIAANPTSHSLHPEANGPEVRYVTLTGFPYLVLYRTTDPAETVVLSVIHNASGPAVDRRAERRG